MPKITIYFEASIVDLEVTEEESKDHDKIVEKVRADMVKQIQEANPHEFEIYPEDKEWDEDEWVDEIFDEDDEEDEEITERELQSGLGATD